MSYNSVIEYEIPREKRFLKIRLAYDGCNENAL